MNTNRWLPSTEANLKQALGDGVFSEGHFFELKESVGETKGDRKETARDLASFAIDGGTFIIGFAEDKQSRKWHPAPVHLAEYAERVEQVAANLIDPPLMLRITEIEAADEPESGYLVVEVPMSPEAPHMVDGAYFARGEKTRVRLNDAQVRRFHSVRADQEAVIDRLLDEELQRDPIAPKARTCGHLYLVARPMNAPRQAAHDVIYGNDNVLWRLIDDGNSLIPRSIGEIIPTSTSANEWAQRSNGVARCSSSLQRARIFSNETERAEEFMVDIEFRVNGEIRVLTGGVTRKAQHHGIFEGMPIAWALRLTHWAKLFADTFNYRGSWQLGVAMNGLHGNGSTHAPFYDGPKFDRDDYRSTTTAMYSQLEDQPRLVADHLVGQFVRALGRYEAAKPHLSYDHTTS